ncbi:uncharacterized protein LOC141904804 [Tubulanus polymorphus]|uniref:uncharacterized protein LOC141904804 n=1 Tax=Tubulanus polymorphus TaxID=672921 RepID=UPI003DA67A71
MSQALKLKGLELWCKKQVEGYPGVDVRNMTSSWRDGLAFCALIHRFRPDIMDFHSLSKENVVENNALAFRIAEKEMGIPALLEAEDMIAMAIPDRLSVITYVSQFYNALRNEKPEGGPNVKRFKTDIKRAASPVPRSQPADAKKPCEEKNVSPAPTSRTSLGMNCSECGKKVYILERHVSGNKLYHRSCFRERRKSESKTPKTDAKSVSNGSPASRGTFLARPSIPTALLNDDNGSNRKDTNQQNKSALISKTVKGPIQGTVVSIRNGSESSRTPQKSDAETTSHVRVVIGKPDGCESPAQSAIITKQIDTSNERKGVLARWPPARDKDGGDPQPMDVDRKPAASPRSKEFGADVAVSKVAPPASSVVYSQIDFSKKIRKADSAGDRKVKAGLLASLAVVRKSVATEEVDRDDPEGTSPTAINSNATSSQSYQINTPEKTTSVSDKKTPNIASAYLKRISGVEDRKTVIDNEMSSKTKSNRPAFYTSPVVDKTVAESPTKRESSESRVESGESKRAYESRRGSSGAKREPGESIGAGKSRRGSSDFKRESGESKGSSESRRGSTSSKRESGESKGSSESRRGSTASKRESGESKGSSESGAKVSSAISYPDLLNPFADEDEEEASKCTDSLATPSKKRAAPRRPAQPPTISSPSSSKTPPVRPQPPATTSAKQIDKHDDEKTATKKKSSNPFLDEDQSDSDIFDDDDFLPDKTSTGRFVAEKSSARDDGETDKNIVTAGNVKSKSVESVKSFDSPKPSPVVTRTKELADNHKNEELERSLSDAENRHSFLETPPRKPKHAGGKPVSPSSARKGRAPPPPKHRKLPKIPDPGPAPEKPPRSMFYDDEVAAIEREKSNKILIHVKPFDSASSPDNRVDRRKILPSREFNFDSTLDSSTKLDTDEEHLYSEISGKNKRPAPPRPLPPRRQVSAPMSREEINVELIEIDAKQTKLEQQGRILEEAIREAELKEASNEESLMVKWFQLVNEKNQLVRREIELIHLAKQQELEAEHNDIEHELRQLMHKQEAQKTKEDKTREEELLKQLLDIVDRRNSIVDIMDEDRLRHEEEDKRIEEMMARKFPGGSEEKLEPKQKKKRTKKREKTKKSKNIGSLLSCTAASHGTL